jgi:formate-dependent nitrite reductase membrane component NrfD
MGIMFLASGISVASAFVAMMTDHKEEERSMTTVSLSALLVEIFLMVQIFVQYMSSGQNHADAGAMIFGGPYTGIFWMVAMFQGLFFPLFMLIMQIKGVFYFKRITPLSVLFGGLLLRFIIVWLGQISEVRLDM